MQKIQFAVDNALKSIFFVLLALISLHVSSAIVVNRQLIAEHETITIENKRMNEEQLKILKEEENILKDRTQLFDKIIKKLDQLDKK